jgi:YHS domain-containing protein
VISFVFADLITFPLLLIYRKYYGGRLAARILVVFWAVMAAGGLIVEGLFSLFGLVPHHRPTTVAPTRFQWNYTTFLNIAFLATAAGLYWLYRNRDRLGGGTGYALDPVCGMQVRTADAPAHSLWQGDTVWFCSDRCKERFDADPARYAATGAAPSTDQAQPVTLGRRPRPVTADPATAIDPVCGMTVDPATAAAHRRYGDRDVWFCNPGCAEAFDADPARYPAPSSPR